MTSKAEQKKIDQDDNGLADRMKTMDPRFDEKGEPVEDDKSVGQTKTASKSKS
ncbi:hypothetical protein [Qipengyuania sp. MTN3-11]|uniref:hypothetical protein n=1 Tax=Qipengyuania sp. MTN3-11 TaxID=3056557 RepID=UPI0036F2791C